MRAPSWEPQHAITINQLEESQGGGGIALLLIRPGTAENKGTSRNAAPGSEEPSLETWSNDPQPNASPNRNPSSEASNGRYRATGDHPRPRPAVDLEPPAITPKEDLGIHMISGYT